MAKFSVIIPAYNEELYLGPCLDSLKRQRSKTKFEIIVIDNASTDRTAEIAKSYEGVRVISEPKKGLIFARQTGFQESTGDVVVYLDADTRVPETWISLVEQAFNNVPDLVCLSGPYRFYDGSRITRVLLSAISATVFWSGRILSGYLVIGGNFAASRAAISRAGGFDETIEFYGDDADIGCRLSAQGKMLYWPEFYAMTSARRFRAEGILKTLSTYLVNYFWMTRFRRPFSVTHRDIR